MTPAATSAVKQVAVIGAGLQATRRIPAILEDPQYRLKTIVDRVGERAATLATRFGATLAIDWRPVVVDPAIDVVLVLTYPDSHAEIALAAMRAGKDVLCEKPIARTEEEAEAMVGVATETGRILKCGFNHRHHPAIQEAYRLFQNGMIGVPLFVRGRYGIAGRPGLENEWRSDPKIVSGGQLVEQGIHLVDLVRWFLGDIVRVTGCTSTLHWPISPLEENGFALCQTAGGAVASIHASLTQWINLFSFEVYGTGGSLTVEGLGGSYGVEKLVTSTHDPTGPFAQHTTEYRGADRSWHEEWREFTRAVAERSEPLGSGRDGLRALEVVHAAYRSARTGAAVAVAVPEGEYAHAHHGR